jgi:hypothetical protein
MNIIEHIHAQRNALSDCGRDIFKGTETIEELAALFRTPQGMEFCEEHSFPGIETWRELGLTHDLSRFGIYVDAGHISLSNVQHVTLIGSTTGELRYDELKRNTVMVMHGARVKIKASGYALVYIVNAGGAVEAEKSGYAKIL